MPQKACHPDWAGEEMVAVATDSEEIAEDALRLIDIEYEPLPFLTRNEMPYTVPGLSAANVHQYDYVHVRLSHPSAAEGRRGPERTPDRLVRQAVAAGEFA